MLTYNIEKNSKKPLYLQLYENIKNDILNLKIKDKLPSKRSLANHLNISVITVENAYNQLIMEGFIYSVPKKGYYANKGIQKQIKPVVQKQNFNENAKFLKEKNLLNLSFSTNSELAFPLSTWKKLLREVLSKNSDEIYEKVPFNGTLKLRLAIKKHLYEYHNLICDENNIIIGAGSQHLYTLISQLLDKDLIYALENPSDTKIGKIYKSLGVKCVFLDIDKSGMSYEKLLKSSANIVHISPSSHFPTGILMKAKRRSELLKWASLKENRYIIEDEYMGEIRQKIVPTLKSLNHEKVIFLNTFSKTLLPTLRVSYMVLPSNLTLKFKQNLSFYSSAVPIFEQLTLAKFINDGYFERFLNKLKRQNLIKKEGFLNKFKELKINNLDATFNETHAFIKSNLSDDKVKQLASKNGFFINTMSDFYYKNTPKNSPFLIDYNCNIENVKKFLNMIL